jgi:hypothetical protein
MLLKYYSNVYRFTRGQILSGSPPGEPVSPESERVIPGFVREELDSAYSTLLLLNPGTLQGTRAGPLYPAQGTQERKRKLHKAIRMSGSVEQAGNGLFALESSLKFCQESDQPNLPVFGPAQLVELD